VAENNRKNDVKKKRSREKGEFKDKEKFLRKRGKFIEKEEIYS
jgi:hypothetical protein